MYVAFFELVNDELGPDLFLVVGVLVRFDEDMFEFGKRVMCWSSSRGGGKSLGVSNRGLNLIGRCLMIGLVFGYWVVCIEVGSR